MKKISLFGLVSGFIAGALVALLSGSWIFWLAIGIAIGVLLGVAGAKHGPRAGVRQSAHL